MCKVLVRRLLLAAICSTCCRASVLEQTAGGTDQRTDTANGPRLLARRNRDDFEKVEFDKFVKEESPKVKYAIDPKPIKEGGPSTVYQANAIDGSGLKVVIKKIALKDPDVNSDDSGAYCGDYEDEMEMFVKETMLLHYLRHPRIVEILEVYVTDEAGWIVLNYLDGCTLQEAIQRFATNRDLPLCFIRTMCQQLLQAIEYLHISDVIHCDIKPNNIMLTRKGIVLLDLGFASEPLPVGMAMRCFIAYGTPYYFAPERLETEGGYGTASDIWSLGVTIMSVCTDPFPGTTSSLMHGIKLKSLKRPWCDWSKIPRELVGFLADCLACDEKDRKSATQLLEHPFIVNGAATDEELSAYLSDFLGTRT